MNHPIGQQALGLLGDLVENLTSIPGWFLDFADARGVLMALLGIIALGLAVFVGVRAMQDGMDALTDPLVPMAMAISFLAWVGRGVLYVTEDDPYRTTLRDGRRNPRAARSERTGESD
jgi:hypothetical protein